MTSSSETSGSSWGLRFHHIQFHLPARVQYTIVRVAAESRFAASIIVCGAALFGHADDISHAGPADFITSLGRGAGRWPAIFFGIGLFDAMVLMTSDKGLMAPHRRTLPGRMWGWAMVGVLIGLTVVTFRTTVLGVLK